MKKNNSVGIILGLLFLVIGGGYLAEVLGFIDDSLTDGGRCSLLYRAFAVCSVKTAPR